MLSIEERVMAMAAGAAPVNVRDLREALAALAQRVADGDPGPSKWWLTAARDVLLKLPLMPNTRLALLHAVGRKQSVASLLRAHVDLEEQRRATAHIERAAICAWCQQVVRDGVPAPQGPPYPRALIDAAPELLAALKGLLQGIDATGKSLAVFPGGDERVQAARAAIDKACHEGEP